MAKDEDFSEICITSESNVIQDEQTEKEIEVTTKKATGINVLCVGKLNQKNVREKIVKYCR